MGGFVSKQIKEMRGYSGELAGEKVVVFPLSGSVFEVDTDVFDQYGRDDMSPLPFLPPQNGFMPRTIINTSRIVEKQTFIKEQIRGWDIPLSVVRSFKEILKKFKFKYIVLAADPDFEGAAIGIDFLRYFRETRGGLPVYAANVGNLSEAQLKKEVERTILERRSAYDWRTYYHIGAMTADMNACIGINETRFLRKYTKSNITFGTQQTRLLQKIVERTRAHEERSKTRRYRLKAHTDIGDFVYQFDDAEKEEAFSKSREYMHELLRVMNIKGNYLKISRVKEEKILKKSPAWTDGAHLALAVSSRLKTNISGLMDKKDGLLQIMYEKGIMTYPRGESDVKMPISQFKKQYAIAKMLSQRYGAERLDFKTVKPYLWKKDAGRTISWPYTIASDEDVYDSLTTEEKIVYDEAAKIVLSAFYPDNKQIRTTIEAQVGVHRFRHVSTHDVDIGWKEIYAIGPAEKHTEEEFCEGDAVSVNEYSLEIYEDDLPLFTENTLYLMMKREKIGAESTFSSHIENILDKRGVKRRFTKIENGYIAATNVGNALIDLVPAEAVDSLGTFQKEVAEPLLEKKIDAKIALARRNDIIERTYRAIYGAVQKGLHNEHSTERKALVEIRKDAAAHPVLTKKRTKAICPACGAFIYRLPSGNYRCENNRPRKNSDGEYENAGSCDMEFGGSFSFKEYVRGTIPEEKEVLESIMRCEQVVLTGEYKTKSGKTYHGNVGVTLDEKHGWYKVELLEWQKNNKG